VHSEHPLDTVQHGIQLWTSLPRARKQMEPRYQRIDAKDIPQIERGLVRVRVIAGNFGGAKGPAEMLMPLFLWHATLPANETLEADLDPGFEAAAYVIDGEGRFASAETVARQGELVIWEGTEGAIRVENAGPKALDLLIFGGTPAEGPLVFHGPFVMNSVDQVRAAEIAYRTGRMGTLA
jgi:redox-sensitive bicupin YhaK (pirin superfamily)